MSKQSKRNRRDRDQRQMFGDLPALAWRVRTGHFGEWIAENGGECIHTTSQYEVARWRRPGRADVAVLYKKQDGSLTWLRSAASDYRAFMQDCYG